MAALLVCIIDLYTYCYFVCLIFWGPHNSQAGAQAILWNLTKVKKIKWTLKQAMTPTLFSKQHLRHYLTFLCRGPIRNSMKHNNCQLSRCAMALCRLPGLGTNQRENVWILLSFSIVVDLVCYANSIFNCRVTFPKHRRIYSPLSFNISFNN